MAVQLEPLPELSASSRSLSSERLSSESGRLSSELLEVSECLRDGRDTFEIVVQKVLW